MIDFIENLFSPVVTILGRTLQFFHYSLGVEWWIAIAMLTVVVRTILFPLTVKQVRSMKAMQELKPEMDKIREKYKDNRQKQQEEQMKLFQERQVNPLGGCLPILVQLPIFMGIFFVIRDFGGSAGIIGAADRPASEPSFAEGGILWFTNLSAHDPYFILPVLSAVTMLISMEITAKHMPAQQRWIMRILPFFITVITWTFPAGLFVYWIANNVVTGVQNYIIYNFGPGRQKTEEEKAEEERKRKALRAKDGEDEEEAEDEDSPDSGSGKSSRERRQARKKKLKKKSRKK
jgi:YidC/Oxa1 family membrane protein insertase